MDPIAFLNDVNLAVELFAKITGNLAAAKDVLTPGQLAEAKVKLAAIQAQGAVLDAEFDAVLGG